MTHFRVMFERPKSPQNSDLINSFRFRNAKCLVQNAYEWPASTYFRVANIKS